MPKPLGRQAGLHLSLILDRPSQLRVTNLTVLQRPIRHAMTTAHLFTTYGDSCAYMASKQMVPTLHGAHAENECIAFTYVQKSVFSSARCACPLSGSVSVSASMRTHQSLAFIALVRMSDIWSPVRSQCSRGLSGF